MIGIHKLYPQYRVIEDRRQQESPVTFERRSGAERRSEDRVKLDTNLTRDIFEIKSKISQVQKTDPKNSDKITFAQNTTNAAQNSIKTDQFVRTTKQNDVEIPKDTKSPSTAPMLAGVFASVLGGMVASAFLGPGGVAVAVGIGTYFGFKLLRQVISTHMKDK